MKTIDKLCNAWMGRHLEFLRHKRGIAASDAAERMGMKPQEYRHRELGRVPITLSFLLRVQLALNVHIEHLWFPLRGRGIDTPDESTTEAALSDLLELMCPVTVEHVLEAAAEAFQVPVSAVASGLGRKRVNEARTAAALVIESIHHLRLTDLARLVCRSPRSLLWSRRQAQHRAGKEFWSKVAAIRSEVESL